MGEVEVNSFSSECEADIFGGRVLGGQDILCGRGGRGRGRNRCG